MALFDYANSLFHLAAGENGDYEIDGTIYNDIPSLLDGFANAIDNTADINDFLQENMDGTLLHKLCDIHPKYNTQIFSIIERIVNRCNTIGTGNWRNLFNASGSRSHFFHTACQNGNLNLVQYLHNRFAVPVDLPNNNGETPLLSVARRGFNRTDSDDFALNIARVATYLTSNGADVNKTNNHGATALERACGDDPNAQLISRLVTSANVESLMKSSQAVQGKIARYGPEESNSAYTRNVQQWRAALGIINGEMQRRAQSPLHQNQTVGASAAAGQTGNGNRQNRRRKRRNIDPQPQPVPQNRNNTSTAVPQPLAPTPANQGQNARRQVQPANANSNNQQQPASEQSAQNRARQAARIESRNRSIARDRNALAGYIASRVNAQVEQKVEAENGTLDQVRQYINRGIPFVVMTSTDVDLSQRINKGELDNYIRNTFRRDAFYMFVQNPGNHRAGDWSIDYDGRRQIITGSAGASCQSYTVCEIMRNYFQQYRYSQPPQTYFGDVLNQIIDFKKDDGSYLFSGNDASEGEKAILYNFFKYPNTPNSSIPYDLARRFQKAIYVYGRTSRDLRSDQANADFDEIDTPGVSINMDILNRTFQGLTDVHGINPFLVIDAKQLRSVCRGQLGDDLVDSANVGSILSQDRRSLLKSEQFPHQVLDRIINFRTSLQGRDSGIYRTEMTELDRYCRQQSPDSPDVFKRRILAAARREKEDHLRRLPQVGIGLEDYEDGSGLKFLEFKITDVSDEVLNKLNATGLFKINRAYANPSVALCRLADRSQDRTVSVATCFNKIVQIVGDNFNISCGSVDNIRTYYQANQSDLQQRIEWHGFESLLRELDLVTNSLQLSGNQSSDRPSTVARKPRLQSSYSQLDKDLLNAINFATNMDDLDIRVGGILNQNGVVDKQEQYTGIIREYQAVQSAIIASVKEEFRSNDDLEKHSVPKGEYSGTGAKLNTEFKANPAGGFIVSCEVSDLFVLGPAAAQGIKVGDKFEISVANNRKQDMADILDMIREWGLEKGSDGVIRVNQDPDRKSELTAIWKDDGNGSYKLLDFNRDRITRVEHTNRANENIVSPVIGMA